VPDQTTRESELFALDEARIELVMQLGTKVETYERVESPARLVDRTVPGAYDSMAQAPNVSTVNNKSTTSPTPDANKPVEAAGKPADPKTASTSPESTTSKDTKSAKKVESKKVLSVAFPAKAVRALKLLASAQGVSIASIVVASVTRTVNKQLGAALESLKSDLEG